MGRGVVNLSEADLRRDGEAWTLWVPNCHSLQNQSMAFIGANPHHVSAGAMAAIG